VPAPSRVDEIRVEWEGEGEAFARMQEILEQKLSYAPAVDAPAQLISSSWSFSLGTTPSTQPRAR
jgi:hypothetical protein